MRFCPKGVPVFGHYIWVRHEFPPIRAGDECQIRHEDVACSDLLQYGLCDRWGSWYALGVGVHTYLNLQRRILCDALTGFSQGNTYEIAIHLTCCVALPSIEGYYLSHILP